jgi:hypothetical protein
MYKSEMIDLIADNLQDSDDFYLRGVEDIWISNGRLFITDDEGITYEVIVEEI